ncbi:unnamed protein product [Musa acuminata var. zebrina]
MRRSYGCESEGGGRRLLDPLRSVAVAFVFSLLLVRKILRCAFRFLLHHRNHNRRTRVEAGLKGQIDEGALKVVSKLEESARKADFLNMDCGYNSPNFHGDDDSSCDSGRKIIVHPLYLPKSSPWLDLKVVYVRLSNYEFNESIPEHLTIKHISLTADTILEVNGRRSGISSDSVSCLLRRDRIDKKSEEVTFVSTDCVRMTGSVRFDVCDGDDMLLSGVLELSNHNGLDVEPKKHKGKWSMRCQTVATAAYHFYDGKIKGSEVPSPIIEVYVAGCSSGTPIILTKTIQLCCQKKHCRKLAQNSFLEDESMELKKEFPMKDVLKVSGYEEQISEKDADIDYYSLHSGAAYIEEDGELSWFNAGVKVGVGISVGVCLGIGIGVGLLVRTYQATRRNIKRRLL